MSETKVWFRSLPSIAGSIALYATHDALIRLVFSDSVRTSDHKWLQDHLGDYSIVTEDNTILDQACGELEEYTNRNRTEFSVPLKLYGTEFQKRVWDELLNIPYGQLTSYQNIADKLGSVSRAVGGANGRNPISVIVPCHRVIASNGALQGYAGGLDIKEKLIKHENAWSQVSNISKAQTLF